MHLPALQQAVVDGVQVVLGYADRAGNASERVVHPLGLVAKGGVWYLVAGTERGQRTFRVSRVRSIVPTGDPVDRPDDFDLAGSVGGHRHRGRRAAGAVPLAGNRSTAAPSTTCDGASAPASRSSTTTARARGSTSSYGRSPRSVSPSSWPASAARSRSPNPRSRAELNRIGTELATLYS